MTAIYAQEISATISIDILMNSEHPDYVRAQQCILDYNLLTTFSTQFEKIYVEKMEKDRI
jgi:hypothetical protein